MLDNGVNAMRQQQQAQKISTRITMQYDMYGLSEDYNDDLLDDLLDAWKQEQGQFEHTSFLQRKLAEPCTWTIFEPAPCKIIASEIPLEDVSEDADAAIPDACNVGSASMVVASNIEESFQNENIVVNRSVEEYDIKDETNCRLTLAQKIKALPIGDTRHPQSLSQQSTSDSLPEFECDDMDILDSLPETPRNSSGTGESHGSPVVCDKTASQLEEGVPKLEYLKSMQVDALPLRCMF
jgi:hypothetical protein